MSGSKWNSPGGHGGDEAGAAASGRRPWVRRAKTIALVSAILIAAFFIGAAFLPRWWAQRIGDQVQGSIASGVGIGLFYGFAFTVLPLLVLWFGFRRRRSWQTWLAFLGVATLLALPNLLTLGIVVGSGNAAHAGERTLDVEAPSFRTSSLIGGIAAVALLATVAYLLRSRRRAREAGERLRAELRERDGASAEPPA
jgi:MFS family permease